MALEIEEKGEDDTPPAAPPPPPRRGPGHRGQDMRDTVAEMAAKAHEISLEAGSKMAAAMKDVIGAAAGYTAFAIESARDLVQYMVRRGQMTQDEADKLIREAEAAHVKNPKTLIPKPEIKPEAKKAPTIITYPPVEAPPVAPVPAAVAHSKAPAKPATSAPVAKAPVTAHKAAAPAKASPPPKSAARAAAPKAAGAKSTAKKSASASPPPPPPASPAPALAAKPAAKKAPAPAKAVPKKK